MYFVHLNERKTEITIEWPTSSSCEGCARYSLNGGCIRDTECCDGCRPPNFPSVHRRISLVLLRS